jgi:hypothetical protein
MSVLMQAAIASSRRRTVANPYLLSDDLEYADNAAAGDVGRWTVFGSPTFGYATSPNGPLAGSYSLKISGFGGDTATTNNFTASADTWVYFVFRITSLAANQIVCTFLDSSGDKTAECTVLTTGAIRLLAGGAGTTVQSGLDLIAAATTYHIWLHYSRSTGSGATMEAWVSLTGVRGDLAISTASGIGSAQATSLRFGPVSSGPALIWDTLRVSASPIGDNPL